MSIVPVRSPDPRIPLQLETILESCSGKLRLMSRTWVRGEGQRFGDTHMQDGLEDASSFVENTM